MTIAKLRELAKRKRDKFAKLMCGYDLTDYQKKILYDDSRRIIVCASRQIGKSTVVAVKALWKAWCFDDQDIMIVAPTERQAEIVYSKIREIVLVNPILMATANKITMRKIEFDNNSKIRCLPAGHTGEYIRGYTADMVIVDEAQSVPDEVFVSVLPALIVKNGQIVVLGTPSHGKVGFFWQAWISNEWSKHRITAYESPFLKRDEIETFRKMKGEIIFRREMMAEFVDADDAFFDIGKVYEVAKIKRRKNEPAENYVYYFGIDWARMGRDHTACVIIGVNVDTEQLEMHNYYLRQKRTMDETLNWVIDLIRKWKPLAVAVDSTSGWGAMADMLRDKLNKTNFETRVVEVNFSKPILRKELYYNLKRMIEEEKIFLLRDEVVLTQFEGFRTKVTTSGIEHIKKEGESDDIVDALALACWCITGGGLGKIYVADFMDIDKVFANER
ncbi:MAG: terminase large subunit [Candidatus Aenigmatarchaeota archaeon]